MGKKLVIVESPAKAKTINKILGADFIVKASLGHVRDLPEKKIGVDIENGFKPTYGVIKGKAKVIQELEAAADKVDTVYLAPDPDREGEAIAWHLMAVLKKKLPEESFFRVTYNEITASAIREAFAHPRRIDQHKVDSQQARRVLDRIVGYKVSPLLWRRIRGGSSAGRVQSVALRLVCEREKAITAFVKEKFWVLGARLRKLVDPRDPFDARLVKIGGQKADVRQAELAEQIEREIRVREFRVAAINTREISKRARPPFITSSLQQAASSVFGFSPSRTMSVAQKLYEGIDLGEGPVGLITYMRTDSFTIAHQAQDSAREFIGRTYGAAYVPEKPNFYKSRGSAQEAHEAIRPTDVNRTPDSLAQRLEPEQLKLYRLIWQRFVASQMAPARISQRSVDVEAPAREATGEAYLFRATASEVLFPGYMRATGEDKKEKKPEANGSAEAGEQEGGEELDALPPLEQGEKLECTEPIKLEKETQPPPRYTEASLVKALEENGVGRPSTYAATISTLKDRKYVELDKRALKPTSVGMNVNDFLVTHLGELFDVKFTAGMEEQLDEIEKGSVEWTQMLSTFYSSFAGWIEKAKGPGAEPAMVAGLLELLGQVKEWTPPQKRGKRTFSDEAFVKSLRTQLESGKKISMRQAEALVSMGTRYSAQISGWEDAVKTLGLGEVLSKALLPPEPPQPETIAKLAALEKVQFDEPRQVGERTFDDKVFSQSLRDQVGRGRRLSFKQVKYLDRLLHKYADQIGGVDELAKTMDFTPEVAIDDPDLGELLTMLEAVKEWKPAVQRGKRLWDDQKFYESLKRQFGQKHSLSPKQGASLRKMVQRYAAAIPQYDEAAVRLGLKPRKAAEPAESSE